MNRPKQQWFRGLALAGLLLTAAAASSQTVLIQSGNEKEDVEQLLLESGIWQASDSQSTAPGIAPGTTALELTIKDGKAEGGLVFAPKLPSDGDWNVEMTWPAEANAAGLLLEIEGTGAAEAPAFLLDTGKGTANQWNSIGSYHFSQSSNPRITIRAIEETVAADASQPFRVLVNGMRLTKAGAAAQPAPAATGQSNKVEDDPFADAVVVGEIPIEKSAAAAAEAEAPGTARQPVQSAQPAAKPQPVAATEGGGVEDPFGEGTQKTYRSFQGSGTSGSSTTPHEADPRLAQSGGSGSGAQAGAQAPLDDPFDTGESTAKPAPAGDTTATEDPFGQGTQKTYRSFQGSGPSGSTTTPQEADPRLTQISSTQGSGAAISKEPVEDPFEGTSTTTTSTEPLENPFGGSPTKPAPVPTPAPTTKVDSATALNPFGSDNTPTTFAKPTPVPSKPAEPKPYATPTPRAMMPFVEEDPDAIAKEQEVLAKASGSTAPKATAQNFVTGGGDRPDIKIYETGGTGNGKESGPGLSIDSVNWKPSLEDALKQASATDSAVLVLFLSDDKPNTQFATKVFSKQVVHDVVGKFVCYKVDPKVRTDIAQKYNVAKGPYLIILNKFGFTQAHIAVNSTPEVLAEDLKRNVK